MLVNFESSQGITTSKPVLLTTLVTYYSVNASSRMEKNHSLQEMLSKSTHIIH